MILGVTHKGFSEEKIVIITQYITGLIHNKTGHNIDIHIQQDIPGYSNFHNYCMAQVIT